MKRSLATVVLLVVMFTSKNACSEITNKESYDSNQVLTRSVLYLDFQRNANSLIDMGSRLLKITTTTEEPETMHLTLLAYNVMLASRSCEATARSLVVLQLIEKKLLSEYIPTLEENLWVDKSRLKIMNEEVRDNYSLANNNDALQQLDKAQKVMLDTLKLYDQAVVLLNRVK